MYLPKLGLVLTTCLLAACATTPQNTSKRDGPPLKYVDVSTIPDAVPRYEPLSSFANPASYNVFGKDYKVMKTASGYKAKGLASWYGRKFQDRPTSSGEPYDMFAMTAAHKRLPIPTYVRVTNLSNSKQIIVRVNDRGPFYEDRIIDLSYAAAKKLGITKAGTALVEIEAIDVLESATTVQTVNNIET